MNPINNRLDLAKHFCDLGFKLGVEVGVLGGTYSTTLYENNPGLKLFAVDSWGMNEIKYGDYHRRKEAEARLRLGKYPGVTLVKKFSLEAVKDFEINSLDFVYIDASHSFDFVMRDIIEWGMRVKRGGIISGHDYINTRKVRIKDAVDIYVKAHGYDLQLTSNKYDRSAVTWWFVKK